MLGKIFLAAVVAMSVCSEVLGQDSSKTFFLTGAVDTYYKYDFAGKQNNLTSFTNSQNSFELGMATVKAETTAMSGKVGATVDLGFGRRAEEFSYNDGESSAGKNGFLTLATLKQVFVTFSPSDALKFTMGKFATHIGYELVDATLNRNYSMSYMFTNGPFFHSGLKADIKAGRVAFMVGITNYTDQSTTTTAVKNIIAQVSGGTHDEKLKFYLNYSGFGGSEVGDNPSGLKSLNQFDLVLVSNFSHKLNVGYNGTIQHRKQVQGSTAADGNWVGNAIYLNFDATATVGLTLRSEYISDSKIIYFGTKHIFANTVSLDAKIGPLTIIPELRMDNSQNKIFLKEDGSPTNHAVSGLLAVLYKF